MSGLRIVMLAPFGIRPKGTLAVRMLPLAQALARRGHTISIIAPPVHDERDAGRRERFGEVEVRHTARSRLPGGLDQVHRLFVTAREARPDVIHLFKPKGYGGLAALALARMAPLVVDTDDWEGRGGWNDLLPYPRVAKALFAWQERDLPRRAAAVTVASRTLQTQVWGFGVPPARVFYLPNGIDGAATGAAARGNGRTLLLYTRFWEFDVRDLIATLAGIVAQRPDARLLVIGRGERGEERQMLDLAERAGVAGAIDYRGWLEPAQIPEVIATADIALVPVDDTLINRARCSAKLLELMAAGLPVVGSRVGQMSEYIRDGESGLLAAPGEPAALARGAIALLNDAALRARLANGARHAVAAFAWDALAPAAERAYRLAV
jgi:glycosyltransferase involved in cell wall biosynthesis